MKTFRFILMIAIAFILSFSTKGYSYDYYYETDYEYADWDSSGAGANGYADSFPVPTASVDVYGNSSKWAFALAILDETVYIVDYDPNTDPPLVGEVHGLCEARAWAYGYTEESSYDAWSSSGGYGGGGSCSTYAEISDPEDADYDVDWFETEVDMSYNGASCSYGAAAFADAQIYSATFVDCGGTGASSTYVNIVEQ